MRFWKLVVVLMVSVVAACGELPTAPEVEGGTVIATGGVTAPQHNTFAMATNGARPKKGWMEQVQALLSDYAIGTN